MKMMGVFIGIAVLTALVQSESMCEICTCRAYRVDCVGKFEEEIPEPSNVLQSKPFLFIDLRQNSIKEENLFKWMSENSAEFIGDVTIDVRENDVCFSTTYHAIDGSHVSLLFEHIFSFL